MLLLRILPVFILALFLSGCESASVKYPSPSAIYYSKNKPMSNNRGVVKRERIKTRKKSHIVFLNCRSFAKKRQSILSLDGKICLGCCYIKLGELNRADALLSGLEKKQLTSKEYARVYALLGVIRVEKHMNGRDYFELSYAYDSNNRLARYMLSVKHPSLDFALQFASGWCKSAH